MTSTTSFKVGDRVVVNPEYSDIVPAQTLGHVFKVYKVNPKNVRCESETPGMRGINYPAYLLMPAPPAGESVPIGRPFQSREFFALGEVVTINADGLNMLRGSTLQEVDEATPMVVVKEGEKVMVTKLGGWDDRYLKMPPRTLVKRTLSGYKLAPVA